MPFLLDSDGRRKLCVGAGRVRSPGSLRLVFLRLEQVDEVLRRRLENLEKMSREGVTLSPETIAAMGRSEGRRNRWRTVALWIIAGTFIAMLCAIRQL